MAKKLFIGGISWDSTEQSLKTFFEQSGKVVSVSIIIDKFTGKSKGFGFVEMETEDEAQNAIKNLNGKMLDGRKLIVNEARPQEPRQSIFQNDFRRGDNNRNFRRNSENSRRQRSYR